MEQLLGKILEKIKKTSYSFQTYEDLYYMCKETMKTDNPPPIDEYSVLWVDTTPELNEDGTLVVNEEGQVTTPYDYIVKKVAKSLNGVSIAISKVSVSG